jgi:hypothetical protein
MITSLIVGCIWLVVAIGFSSSDISATVPLIAANVWIAAAMIIGQLRDNDSNM